MRCTRLGYQAPGPNRHSHRPAIFRKQVAIERIVAVFEEGARATVAALDDVVRVTGDDDAGETAMP